MKFVSRKIRELRVILKPTDRVIDEQRRVTIIPGKRAEFMNYEYKTSDPEMIVSLRKHPSYGVEFAAAGDIDRYIDIYKETGKAPEEVKGQFINPQTNTLLSVPDFEDIKVEEAKPGPSKKALPEPIEPAQLEAIIDNRIKTHLDQLTATLVDLIQHKDDKPKKVFKCPICKEVFPSGIAVGKHKKLVH